MQNHAQNVFGSKAAAKQDLMTMLMPTLGATALYLIPMTLLSLAASLYLGSDLERMLSCTPKQYAICIAAVLAVNLFLLQPVYFGLTQFYAFRRAGARPSLAIVTMALGSFILYRKAISMALSILVHSILWAIPAGMAAGASALLYHYVLPNQLGEFLMFEICFAVAVLYLCMTMRYQCAYVLVIEKPTLSSWSCVREAAVTFRGHKRELLSLMASFLFWIAMTILFGNMILLILYPYFLLALFHLFDRIRGIQVKIGPKPPEQEEK